MAKCHEVNRRSEIWGENNSLRPEGNFLYFIKKEQKYKVIEIFLLVNIMMCSL